MEPGRLPLPLSGCPQTYLALSADVSVADAALAHAQAMLQAVQIDES